MCDKIQHYYIYLNVRRTKMNIKNELIQSHIAEMIKKLLEDNIIDYTAIANTNAIMILDKVKNIVGDETLTDFEIVEEIVCIFEQNGIDCGTRHDL